MVSITEFKEDETQSNESHIWSVLKVEYEWKEFWLSYALHR